MGKLDGKIALVTGVGLATARRFVAEGDVAELTGLFVDGGLAQV